MLRSTFLSRQNQYADMFAGSMQAGMQMQRMLLPLQQLKQQQQLRRLVLVFEQGH